MRVLRELSNTLSLSVRSGDLLMLDARWYVTHSGLLRVAQRRRCSSITTELAEGVSSSKEGRWVFKATVVKWGKDQHFVGYGDADPSNVSFLVHGAEMRVAETHCVPRHCASPLRNSWQPRRKSGVLKAVMNGGLVYCGKRGLNREHRTSRSGRIRPKATGRGSSTDPAR